MQDSNTHTVKQYTKDQLQLAAMHIGKATQEEEKTAPGRKYIYTPSRL